MRVSRGSFEPAHVTARRIAGRGHRGRPDELRRSCGVRRLALALAGADGTRRTLRTAAGATARIGCEAIPDGATRVLDLPGPAIDGDVDVRLVAQVAVAVLVRGEPDPQDAWGAAERRAARQWRERRRDAGVPSGATLRARWVRMRRAGGSPLGVVLEEPASWPGSAFARLVSYTPVTDMQVTPSGALQAKVLFASRPDAEQPARSAAAARSTSATRALTALVSACRGVDARSHASSSAAD